MKKTVQYVKKILPLFRAVVNIVNFQYEEIETK